VQKEDYYHALREVINHCIYGVDRNPMALELARTALWLEGYEPGQPLSFLGHHLVCGDALLGLTDFKQLEYGIPKDAFKALSGDSKEICKELGATNTAALKDLKKRLKDKNVQLFAADEFEDIFAKLDKIEKMPDDTTRRVKAKERAYAQFLEEAQDSSLAHAADLVTAAYLTTKDSSESSRLCPTTDTLLDLLFSEKDRERPTQIIEAASRVSREAQVLHWPLAFAQIFARGGFSCVLGNPPWEMLQLDPQEYFAARAPAVANAKNMAARDRMITELAVSAPALYQQYYSELRKTESIQAFVHSSERFKYSGHGRINTASLFTETFTLLTSVEGRAGLVSPSGIATDSFTQKLWRYVSEGNRLISLYDFENRLGIFAGVHRSYKFCLLTLGQSEEAEFAFFLHGPEQIDDSRRTFTLSSDDFGLINPNTLTCPVFRSNVDAELTKKVYRRVPALLRESSDSIEEENPWGIQFQLMFMMNTDSVLFQDEPVAGLLPLYEAKMMHQFDHRWATYYWNKDKNANDSQNVELAQKADSNYNIRPRYWVDERQVIARIARAPKCVIQAWLAGKPDCLLKAVANWIESANEDDLLSGFSDETPRQRVIAKGGDRFDHLPKANNDWRDGKAVLECQNWDALTESELQLTQTAETLDAALSSILDSRSPRWLMGWRDICRSTDERTVIASVIPRVGVGNNMPIMLFDESISKSLHAALLGNLVSLVFDFVARHKVGGIHLNFFIYKQLPVLPPESYNEVDLDYIVPRVLELTYTSHDLKPWAEDLGYHGEPFGFDPDHRAQLRAELDAYYAKLYGLTRDELRYILDPSDTHGDDYPSETFRGLKNKDIKAYNEYRTQRQVLEAWDALEK